MPPRVVAIIATYNEERFIGGCLEHLFANGVEVYLCDNRIHGPDGRDCDRELAASEPTRITLLIAHRLGTVAGADRIHVLDRGQIVDTGTHAEFLARGGLYARMWREQSEVAEAVTQS